MKNDQDLSQSLLSATSSAQSNNQKAKDKYLDSIPEINGKSFLSAMAFGWLHNFMKYSSKHGVQTRNMPKLPQDMKTKTQYQRLVSNWNSVQRSQKEGFRLIKAICKTYTKEMFVLFAFVFVDTLFWLVSPILTSLNISYIQNYKDDKWYGVQLFLLTLLSQFINKTVFNQFLYRMGSFGVNLKNNLNMMVFAKSMNYSTLANKDISQTEIINYSEVDAERMTYVGYSMASLVYGPMQIIFGLVMIYLYVGLSFSGGIGVIIFLLIMSYFLSKKENELNDLVLEAKDERMKKTQEMLDIIRFIKISAIQKFFYSKIEEKRIKEMGLYWKKGIYGIFLMFTFWVSCPLLLSVTFILYVQLGNQISSQIAFTVMMLASLIQYPIFSFPTAISDLIQVLGSMRRIQAFLHKDQILSSNYTINQSYQQYAVKIENGNFYWGKQKKKQDDKSQTKDQQQSEKLNQDQKNQKIKRNEQNNEQIQQGEENKDLLHALKNINLSIEKGKLTMIIGDIGSGKSSLLLAILNEMFYQKKTAVHINGSIAYSAQKSWITSQSVMDNILFTLPYNQKKFRQAIKYSCFEEDLKSLPQGDKTQIGQKGINISGGQKARLSLARALYSQKDIYLLDDILSAVDVHVGQFIVRQTLKGYLYGKTILLPTHAIKFLQFSDQIIIMKKGQIIQKGSFSQIKLSKDYQQIVQQEQKKKQKQQENSNKDQTKVKEQIQMLKQLQKRKTSNDKPQEQIAIQNNSMIERLMIPQDQEKGELRTQVFTKYIQYGGGFFKFIFLGVLSAALYAVFKVISSILMEKWCEHPEKDQTYLYLYVASIMTSSLFVLLRSVSILRGSIKASKNVYKLIVKSLLCAGLSDFYNRIPIGRIVNRLTKDLRQLDEDIYQKLNWFIFNVFEILISLFICIYASSILSVIPMIIVAYISYKLRIYYMKTKREVARFQKSTNSPLVSGFIQSINGLASIRAYKVKEQFTKCQIELIDENKKVRFNNTALEGWFGLTLSLISFLINMPCIAYCLLGSNENPSLIGLLMIYAISLSERIMWINYDAAELEVKFVSVQRLLSFINIQPEKGLSQIKSQNWDEQQYNKNVVNEGRIQFTGLKARYRASLPDVIKGVTCSINRGQKIGIVGRTGAGKTSIINTLMRITQISSGKIKIDGKDISQFSLGDLRHSLTMIDQQPTLINSTFRQNLDITGNKTDQQLKEILVQCNLYDIIQEKGGLDVMVSNNSLSAGQKQLLCICRAFLKKSKVVLVDEATANIDVKNDALIQKVIAQKFKQSTVLTIAHRLSTLESSDKIMVLEKGQLVEFGRPSDLEQIEGGFYAQMIKKDLKQLLI